MFILNTSGGGSSNLIKGGPPSKPWITTPSPLTFYQKILNECPNKQLQENIFFEADYKLALFFLLIVI